MNSGRTGLLSPDVRLLLAAIESLANQVDVEYGLLAQFQSRDMETLLMDAMDIEQVLMEEEEDDGGISDAFLGQRAVQNRLALKRAQVRWLRRFGPQVLVTARGALLALDGLPTEVLSSDSLGERVWLETQARLDSLREAARAP